MGQWFESEKSECWHLRMQKQRIGMTLSELGVGLQDLSGKVRAGKAEWNLCAGRAA